MTKHLRNFEREVVTWRQVMTSLETLASRTKLFEEVTSDLAGFIARGIERSKVADALEDIRQTHLAEVSVDDVQMMISDAFARAAAEADFPDDVFDKYDRPKGNGRDYKGKEFEREAPKGFKLKRFEAITLSRARNYLVKGILPRVGLAVIWGPPKCGKSFWTFDIMMHVALGWEYRGRRVQQGPVVYLALEGGTGFAARVEAWRRHHLADHKGTVPFYLLDVPVDLVADRDKLIATIRAELDGQMPAAVVIDTLNRALIGDENKSDDMAKFIRAADLVRATFNCLVPVIHHCGVAGGRPRGHTSLSGADDVQIAVERDDSTGIISVRVEHMKDGEASAPMASRLERVELGIDEDGDPITSCVIVPTEGGVPKKGAKLNDAARLALDQLHETIADTGEPAPASNHVPPDVRVCSAVLWRENFYKAYPADKPDTKQRAFVRACLRLQELNLIGLWSDKAWVPDNPDKARQNGKMSG